jgi:phosphatidate cytidylyltransferase
LLWYSVLVREDPLRNAAITVFGLMWVGGLLAFAVAMSRSENYRSLVVGLVSVAAAMDIGAYFVGRSVGKRKLAPKLSPKKTVEGLVGGALSAVAVAVVLVQFEWFDPITTSGSFLIAAGVIAAAPIGDLAESMVKRSFGIKDMGSALPGHGGILDRIDALLFVVPVGYYVYDILGYLG